MNPLLSTLVECDAWNQHEGFEVLASEVIAAAVAATNIKLAKGAEVSLLLCDDARIRDINHEWRGLDKPTNVLSFPAAPRAMLAKSPAVGDIAIAYETVARETVDEGKTFRDHYMHMVLHGFLHLLGYDHETDAEAEEMEALEISVLGALGVADPYATLDLDLTDR
jgi:probable rRNA maturation factor